MNQNLSILYEPFRLKNLELKNRLVMAPMHTKFSSETGEVTDRLSAYLEARARGGIGLIVLENTCIDWVYGRPAGIRDAHTFPAAPGSIRLDRQFIR